MGAAVTIRPFPAAIRCCSRGLVFEGACPRPSCGRTWTGPPLETGKGVVPYCESGPRDAPEEVQSVYRLSGRTAAEDLWATILLRRMFDTGGQPL